MDYSQANTILMVHHQKQMLTKFQSSLFDQFMRRNNHTLRLTDNLDMAPQLAQELSLRNRLYEYEHVIQKHLRQEPNADLTLLSSVLHNVQKTYESKRETPEFHKQVKALALVLKDTLEVECYSIGMQSSFRNIVKVKPLNNDTKNELLQYNTLMEERLTPTLKMQPTKLNVPDHLL